MLRLRKPSPAMVVACISLFIGLSGVGTAAIVLKKNSVLSKHIRNGQVKRADLGTNAVSSVKVGDGSLLAQDFAAGQLPSGPQGPPGLSGHHLASGVAVTLDPGETDSGVLNCPSGERALGGGAAGDVTTNVEIPGLVMNSSYPFGTADGSTSGWRVAMTNTDTVERIFAIYVYCAKVAP